MQTHQAAAVGGQRGEIRPPLISEEAAGTRAKPSREAIRDATTSHPSSRGSVNMSKSGLATCGQSQDMSLHLKPAESRRWCGERWRRRHCIFLFLVSAAVLFFCNTNLGPSSGPKLWTQYNATELWNRFKIQKNIPPKMKGYAMRNSGPDASKSSTEVVANATTLRANAPEGTRHLADGATTASKPAPYVSPGPYVVEYPYKYNFIINQPKKCEELKPFVVLMVPVAPQNREHRDIIRKSWGGESEVLGKVVKLFFLLGLNPQKPVPHINEQLLQESLEHGDLIQSDFVDCYKNLTIKTMVMLEWLDAHCSGAAFAMKIDSDMFLNVPNLIRLVTQAPKTNYMTGLVAHNAAVLRDPHSKWYLPPALYSQPMYPRYALGLGYVLSLDLPKKLVKAAQHVKALYIEDVYLGLCMEYLGIPPTNPPSWEYFNVLPVKYSRCAYSKIIASTTDSSSDRLAVWRDFKSNPC